MAFISWTNLSNNGVRNGHPIDVSNLHRWPFDCKLDFVVLSACWLCHLFITILMRYHSMNIVKKGEMTFNVTKLCCFICNSFTSLSNQEAWLLTHVFVRIYLPSFWNATASCIKTENRIQRRRNSKAKFLMLRYTLSSQLIWVCSFLGYWRKDPKFRIFSMLCAYASPLATQAIAMGPLCKRVVAGHFVHHTTLFYQAKLALKGLAFKFKV